MNSLAPIVLFAYNRPVHSEKTLHALSENILADQSQLFIYCDGPKPNASSEQLANIEKVRAIVKSRKWCGEVIVIEQEKNKGLANSVISGVSEICERFGKIIVLEDDLITAKHFLIYMNEALNKYANEETVMQVSGYNFPVPRQVISNSAYFLPLTTSWGWATWKRAWDKFDKESSGHERLNSEPDLKFRFDLDGTMNYSNMLKHQVQNDSIDSWAIRWWWSVFMKNGLCLYPDKTLISNIGFTAEATHTFENPFNEVEFDRAHKVKLFPSEVCYDSEEMDALKIYLGNLKRPATAPQSWTKRMFKLFTR